MRAGYSRNVALLLAAALLLCDGATWATAQSKDNAAQKKNKKPNVVAGAADLLKVTPKKFATFVSANDDGSSVTLRVDGQSGQSTWPVISDAEIKVNGWWGRLDQLRSGDRVWVWFAIDRKKTPKGILMLADEISEQDIHGMPLTLESVDPNRQTVTVLGRGGEAYTAELADGMRIRTGREGYECSSPGEPLVRVNLQSPVFVQRNGDRIRSLASAEGLEAARAAQKQFMRTIWATEGLPGSVMLLNPLAGEMDVLLDHEAMRWGRYLKQGDAVTLMIAEPIKAVVRQVQPERERTVVRLVTQSGLDQADLSLGERVRMKGPQPPPDLQMSEYPLDMDRPRSKQERIKWFLATVYCTCSIDGDKCTGMFYTQSSCNENMCGMPDKIRTQVAQLIDKGLTDKAILAELEKDSGPNLLKPHLLQ